MIALFLAGGGPGIALLLLFIIYSMIYARFGGQEREPKSGWDERKRATLKALPAVLLAVLIISGIYSGAFTPTEAAAIGFAAALLITAGMRVLTWKALKLAIFDTMATTVAIILIIAGAKVFGKAITLYRIPQDISMMISQGIDTEFGFIIVVTVVLLIMGLVFEALSMVLIMTPVLLPAALALGFDPIWVGVYMGIMADHPTRGAQPLCHSVGGENAIGRGGARCFAVPASDVPDRGHSVCLA